MAKVIKNNFGNFLVVCLIFLMVTSWIFSGWPSIWQNPQFPPEINQTQAATTGEVFPSLGETVSESPWSDNTWDTPTNIYLDDAATANVTAATFSSPDQTDVLKATGFDFSAIPDNATINGVIVRVNSWYRTGQGAGSMDLCQLLNTSKAKVGTNQCATPVALTTDDTTIIEKGSSSDKWGNDLTVAWVKSANFGVAIGILATDSRADVDVDYVTIEIDYTVPVVLTQTSYRWQNDDGDSTNDPTTGGNVNNNTNSAVADTSLAMEKGERATWRVQIENSGGATTTSFKLQWATTTSVCSDSLDWTDVGESTEIAWSDGLAGTNSD